MEKHILLYFRGSSELRQSGQHHCNAAVSGEDGTSSALGRVFSLAGKERGSRARLVCTRVGVGPGAGGGVLQAAS